MFADVPIVPYLFAVTFGMAYAILAVPATFLTSYLLGPGDYSSNYGIVNMFLCLGMSFGSPISAFIYDNTKSYYPAWIMYTFIALITLALLWLSIARFKNIKQNKQSWGGVKCTKILKSF
ncbi:hypothetical protein [Tepidanaerobacter acetatoxydans]|uniref:hypothetical protein n=1 Tax=Tepidanaerobacter acetatoxydans TaxID=499229 RepID=UPI003B5A09A5